MEFKIERTLNDRGERVVRFKGEIREDDLNLLRFNKPEYNLMHHTGPDAPASAQLLVLEMIYRRAEAEGKFPAPDQKSHD